MMTKAAAWAVGVLAVIAAPAAIMARTAPAPEDEPLLGPVMQPDTGAGEMLIVVLGGVYATRAEAEAANEGVVVGDVQGYYVVPVAQFQGFREAIGAPGEFALVAAFRTEEGAEEFASAVRSFGFPAAVLPTRVRSLGGLYAGLGQEAHPDGSGPLLEPVPGSLP